MEPDIIIYSAPMCPYCMKVKDFFNKKDLRYKDIDISKDPEVANMVVEKTGKKTVPQIFINNTHIGGWDDLNSLDKSGKLQELLA